MRVRRQGWQCGSASQRFLKNATARRISGMLTVIIVIHLMLVLALIGVVMLQKSEGGGLISSTSGFLSSRGTANVLSRTTALLAAGFFATSLVLSWLAGFQRHPTSIINSGAPASQETPAGAPQPPSPGQQNGGVLNQLQKGPDRRPALSQHLADRRYRNRSNGALPALLGWNASPISNRRPPPELRSCLKILI